LKEYEKYIYGVCIWNSYYDYKNDYYLSKKLAKLFEIEYDEDEDEDEDEDDEDEDDDQDKPTCY